MFARERYKLIDIQQSDSQKNITRSRRNKAQKSRALLITGLKKHLTCSIMHEPFESMTQTAIFRPY